MSRMCCAGFGMWRDERLPYFLGGINGAPGEKYGGAINQLFYIEGPGSPHQNQ